MGRLQGKVTLVTGAASQPGLGSATALRFAAEGAFVHLTDVDLAGAERVAQAIRAAGGQARAHVHDVTDPAQWDAVFAAIEAEHGRLDVLVNNAGIALVIPLSEMTSAQWQRQLSVNLDSVFEGARRAVALMRKGGGGGSIINISSTAGLTGIPGGAAYCASKGGVRLMSKALAVECGRDGIRVNSVHPGMILTNMNQGATGSDEAAMMMAMVPMGRMGEPADIAAMNLFLASDESRYVTGTELVVDGGLTAI